MVTNLCQMRKLDEEMLNHIFFPFWGENSKSHSTRLGHTHLGRGTGRRRMRDKTNLIICPVQCMCDFVRFCANIWIFIVKHMLFSYTCATPELVRNFRLNLNANGLSTRLRKNWSTHGSGHAHTQHLNVFRSLSFRWIAAMESGRKIYENLLIFEEEKWAFSICEKGVLKSKMSIASKWIFIRQKATSEPFFQRWNDDVDAELNFHVFYINRKDGFFRVRSICVAIQSRCTRVRIAAFNSGIP